MKNNILYPELDDADYKEMYLIMMRASEKAIRILIEAQQTCEELYLNPKKKEPPIDFERLLK
jgi:beta-xylosidase